MEKSTVKIDSKIAIQSKSLDNLFKILKETGYTVVGPTIQEKAIVYDELASINDLPIGWTDDQEGGTYRLKKRSDNSYFGYNVGPHSWKKFLFPSNLLLWQAKRKGKSFQIIPQNIDGQKYAFLGVRSCELHAIEIQDKVFMKGEYVDPIYKTLREKALIIAVNCGQAGGTCFCVSMKAGPKAISGFDISLTEIINGEDHRFLVEVGSEKGAEIMKKVPGVDAKKDDIETAERIVEKTASSMGRTLDTNGIKELLYSSHDSEIWDDVSKRCLSCANCTLVCPTCFCSNVEDVTDLTGENSERWRKWDSCFSVDYSHIHGGSVRSSVKSRYRQWMTHKLASWIDQFETSGCVGCGRCITWCPVAIDITQEVDALRQSEYQENNISKE